MHGKPYNLPEYLPPEPDLHFMASENRIYDYSNLFHFALRLREQLKDVQISEKRPVFLLSDSTDELVFTVAALFLINLPYLVIRPDTSGESLKRITAQIQPSCILKTGNELKIASEELNCPILHTEKWWMEREGYWMADRFTLKNPENIAGYFLTSGTTSSPKIVPTKRRQVLFAAHGSEPNVKPAQNAYWLLCLPLNHVGGISIIYRSVLYHSALYRMDTFDAEAVATFLTENPLFEAASMVPTMLMRLMQDPLFKTHSSFKAILLGGGRIPSGFIDEAVTRGIPVVSSYGMTETCAQIAANPILRPSGTYYPKSSVGDIFPPNLIQIRDEEGKVLSSIEEGLIWLKGPQVFDGYTDKSLNEGVFDEEGWFCTGDYGHLNRNRQLFIGSRRTDLIVTGGENVNPYYVESVLNRLDKVTESAVFGVPDSEWGQRVVALITAGDKNTDPAALRLELGKQLHGFQIPKEIHIVDELPKTDLGKIRRTELVEIFKLIQ
jgi:O-succinylbenzoic acid--CoA ligase